MIIKLYNTLTRSIEEFVPIQPDKVTLYTCGPTVYDYPHIGNWTAYIYWDVLVRILTENGYSVERVMNITDVGHLTSDEDEGEDKLEVGAKREGKSAWDIADFYTDNFLKGWEKLGLVQSQKVARATNYIPQQLDLIRKLRAKGYTYQTSDGIYYDTAKFPTYADFARLNIEGLKAGARVEYNTEKHNPSDFALWKFTPNGVKRDMEWETPADLLDNAAAGNPEKVMGFPGWHLECSAIILTLLGETIDIHTGGIDHIPVHHTNEIAQSEAATGKKLANYWLHNNHMKVDGSKISKSLGNGLTIEDLEQKGFSPMDFKLFVLQGNFRNEGNFTFDSLTGAKNRLANWRDIAALRHQAYDTLQETKSQGEREKSAPAPSSIPAIVEAVSNNLGTPEALEIIDGVFNSIKRARVKDINRDALQQLLEKIDNLLGLQLIASTPDISEEIKRLIVERNAARLNQDWSESDRLRQEIEKHGITVRDSSDSTIWGYKLSD